MTPEMSLAVFASVVSLVELSLIVVTFSVTSRHFKIVRASSYIERFNSDEFVRTRMTVDAWLDRLWDRPYRALAELDRDRELNARVRLFANLFQELAVGYYRGIVAKDVVADTFDYLVPHYWGRLEPWVRTARSAGSPTMYANFERLGVHFGGGTAGGGEPIVFGRWDGDDEPYRRAA